MTFKKITLVLMVLFSVLLVGAKGCETNTKADVIETLGPHEINTKDDIIDVIPGLKEYARKFDIRRYRDLIKLTTYDILTFQEAVHKLRTETSMNKPVNISLYFRGKYLESEGKFKSECGVKKAVSYTGDELRPYIGIIYIRDGYWNAIEFDAVDLFSTAGIDIDDTVLVTEYAYANQTVYKINDFSPQHGFMSLLNENKSGKSIKGNGSTPYEIITEFDR